MVIKHQNHHCNISFVSMYNRTFQIYKTQYPVYFNLGAHKEIDKDILFSLDLSTGFNNSTKNSKNWKLSTGIVFNRDSPESILSKLKSELFNTAFSSEALTLTIMLVALDQPSSFFISNVNSNTSPFFSYSL